MCFCRVISHDLIARNSIVFIADFQLCASNALQTIALFDRLLLSTGLGHASLDPRKFETTVEDGRRSRLQGSLRNLLSDLREKVGISQLDVTWALLTKEGTTSTALTSLQCRTDSDSARCQSFTFH